MTNPNDNKNYREAQEESYTDNNGNTHTNVTRTSETVNNKVDPQSYDNGYVSGKTSERIYQQETLAERDNENANRGLLIGILLTALTGLIGGSLWYFTQRDQAVDNTVAPVAVPVPATSASPNPTPTVTLTPQSQTTIIERTKQVPVTVEKTKEVPVFIPVPQQKAAPTPTVTPNINITVPPQQPAAKQTPATPTSPTSSNSSSQSGNSTATPSQEQQTKTDVTPGSSSATTENDNQDSSTR
jgi:hypothetical protein